MIEIVLEETLFLDMELLSEDIFDLDFPEEYFLDVELFSITDEAFVDLEAELQNIELELDIGTVIEGQGYPLYSGPYEARPKTVDQYFDTDHKSLLDDFLVHKITYLEAPNIAGGLTVTIGDI